MQATSQQRNLIPKADSQKIKKAKPDASCGFPHHLTLTFNFVWSLQPRSEANQKMCGINFTKYSCFHFSTTRVLCHLNTTANANKIDKCREWKGTQLNKEDAFCENCAKGQPESQTSARNSCAQFDYFSFPLKRESVRVGEDWGNEEKKERSSRSGTSNNLGIWNVAQGRDYARNRLCCSSVLPRCEPGPIVIESIIARWGRFSNVALG